jgi:hypothetical protein
MRSVAIAASHSSVSLAVNTAIKPGWSMLTKAVHRQQRSLTVRHKSGWRMAPTLDITDN